MRPASRLTGQLVAFAAMLLATLPAAFAQSPPPLGEAFEQGKTLGRTGNAAARGTISGSTAQSTVPSYTISPPEASYFGSPGLGSQAAARASACASGPAADPSCTAVQFSQTNPSQRPTFSIAPTDPLLTRGRAITADPQAIAGNIAGTYSGCAVQTVTTPDRFETAICHQYRTLETVSSSAWTGAASTPAMRRTRISRVPSPDWKRSAKPAATWTRTRWKSSRATTTAAARSSSAW